MDLQRLKDFMRSRLKAVGKNAKEASLAAHLGESALRDILNGRVEDPRMGTLAALAPVLHCSLQDFCDALGAIPVLGTEPSASAARVPKAAHTRPRNRLGELLVERGVDGRDLAKRTKIPVKRLAAIANGAETTMAELDAIAEALGLGVFDIFDFAPLTRDEAALVIDLRHIGAEDRKHVRAYIEAMKLKAANDQKVGNAVRATRKKSA